MGICISTSGRYFLYKKIWKKSRYCEYRAPYDSELKVEIYFKKPKSLEFSDFEKWCETTIQGSWSIRLDMGQHSNSKVDWLYEDIYISFSRHEDAALFALTWQ